MKSSNRIALLLSLSTVLLCGTALAQDGISTSPGLPAAKPMHHHHKAHEAHETHAKAHAKAVNGGKYENCVKEKTSVAQYYCSANPGSCQAEKDGVAKQCKSEARGERQKG